MAIFQAKSFYKILDPWKADSGDNLDQTASTGSTVLPAQDLFQKYLC